MEYVITVGLEIHLKLATATKIFVPVKMSKIWMIIIQIQQYVQYVLGSLVLCRSWVKKL